MAESDRETTPPDPAAGNHSVMINWVTCPSCGGDEMPQIGNRVSCLNLLCELYDEERHGTRDDEQQAEFLEAQAARAEESSGEEAQPEPLSWESRALNAEDALIKALVYAREHADRSGLVIPRFILNEAEALVPDWRERHPRPLQARAQIEALNAALVDPTVYVPKPLLPRSAIEEIKHGSVHLVRLVRLYQPAPVVVFEGEARISVDGTLLNVDLSDRPDIGSWAEYDLRDSFDGDALVGEDYRLEFPLAPPPFAS